MNRRTLLKTGSLFLGRSHLTMGRDGDAESEVVAAVEAAHAEIWRRFVDSRFDVLLHYVDLDGKVVLPTATDCAECKPNGMSWSTPIEDGPFFGGLFLDGLCNRWRVRRDAESARAARRIAAGLLHLGDLSPTPGFVPRGIAADGRSFYPASSEDQVFPWFYGLWCYLQSGLAEGAERKRVDNSLHRTGLALEAHQWRVPCAKPEFGYRGGYTRAKAHDGARLLFLLRAMHQLTGEKRWVEQYRAALSERPEGGSATRLEICAAGLDLAPPKGGESFIWTRSMSQAALRALADAEDDSAIAAAFHRGLLATARSAIPHLARSAAYRRDNDLSFDVDWRFLNDSWKPQPTCDDAIAVAKTQLPLWAQKNPRSSWEDDTMREPLFAAWILLLANDLELTRAHTPAIHDMLKRYEWSGLRTASFFISVNIHSEDARPPAKF